MVTAALDVRPGGFRKAAGLTVLSGILSSLSFVPYNIYPLGFIGLIPVFFVFENFAANKKQMFYLWVIWTMILNFIGYHWIMHTIAVYGMMPTWVAFPIFLLYCLGTGSKMLLFFIFLQWVQKRQDLFGTNLKRLLAIPAGFGAAEIIGWQLFPWHGGNLVSGDYWFAQNADLIGTRGLSVVWVILQYLIFLAIKEYSALPRNSLALFMRQCRYVHVFLLLFTALHVYGYVRMSQFSAAEAAAPQITVGVPQGNVPLITRYHERPYIISRMVGQTQKLVADATNVNMRPDLIVWPESSIPAMEFETSAPLKGAITDLQKTTLIPIIINDILHEQKTNKDYSNMWHLDNTGVPLNSYQKNFLLPFGEFMPLGETFPSLKNLFPAVSDFSHGQKFSLFNIATKNGIVKAMPLVCYEVILPDYARGFDARTDKEAQFIINITNDAWFGDSVESLQHMTLGVMRAIELRLPIVRATNSGISAYISSTGEVSGQTKLFERVNQLYKVPAMVRSRTVFSYAGNFPLYVFIMGVLLWIWLRRQKPAY